jgi:pSer/pThr/pTyr-binding forkhead associated (FHA) protein
VLQLITEGGQVGEIHKLDRPETFIGRVDGDVIFPHDGFMSSRHARVIERGGRYFLCDQNSRNGTFIRIDREAELKAGDMFLVGKQLFRFEK